MNILDHFNFENVGSRIEDLETPVRAKTRGAKLFRRI